MPLKPKTTLRFPAPKPPDNFDVNTSDDESEDDQIHRDVRHDLDIAETSTSHQRTRTEKKSVKRSQAEKTVITDPPADLPTEATKTPPGRLLLQGPLIGQSPSLLNYFATSTYIPDLHNLFAFLYEMQTLASESRYMFEICPGYISLSTSIYYGILAIIRILLARRSIKALSNAESVCLRRFERSFPFLSLPVAGPLAGFFETLGAVKLLPGYGSIAPSLPDFAIFTAPGNVNYNVPGLSRIPNIPMMIQLWRDIRNGVDMRANLYKLIYWANNTVDKLNVAFATPAEYTRLLLSAGWYPPLAHVSSPHDIVALRIQLQRQIILPDITGVRYNSVSNFLGMIDSADLTWFSQLVSIAEKEASLFEGATTFGALPEAGTKALLVEVLNPLIAARASYTAVNNPDQPCLLPNNTPPMQNISVNMRYGSETDFKLGTSASYLTTYPRLRNASLDTVKVGPWFNRNVNVLTPAALALRSSPPVVMKTTDILNPARFAGQILRSYYFKPHGEDA